MRHRGMNIGFAFLAVLTLSSTAAQAHPGHGNYGLAGGFKHPFSGIDHLLSMIAVGLWAVQTGGRAMWLWPASFVSVMILGGVSAKLGLQMNDPDTFITTSLLILGLLIAASAKLPVAWGAAIVGLFAFFHGYAHVREGVLKQGNSMLGFAIGFVLATVILHAIGIGLGLVLRNPRRAGWLRFAGAGISVCAVLISTSWIQT